MHTQQQFEAVGIALIFLGIIIFGLITSVEKRMQKKPESFDDAMRNVPDMNHTPTF